MSLNELVLVKCTEQYLVQNKPPESVTVSESGIGRHNSYQDLSDNKGSSTSGWTQRGSLVLESMTTNRLIKYQTTHSVL